MIADHIGRVVALRQLARKSKPMHERIAEPVKAIDALWVATQSWTAFAPKPAALDAAIVQADAIARSLRELRAVMHSTAMATG